MKRNIKNILLASGAAVGSAALLTAYLGSAEILMRLAVARNEPLSSEIGRAVIAGSDELTRAMSMLLDASKKLEQRNLERLEINGRGDTTLVGHYLSCREPKRIIIAMHGWRSSWFRDFGVISDFWHNNNCDVLFAEQRGQGNSGGEFMAFGLLERYDCLDWINIINERSTASLPIYLAGVSMGATTVLMSGGFELPGNVRGIIADCGFTSPHAIWKHVAEKNLHIPYGLYHYAVDDILKKKMQIGAADYSSTEAMHVCSTPVLFIHGTNDSFVPIEMTYENYKACRAPKRLFVVPGASHGLSYLVDKEGYEQALEKFWSDFDIPKDDRKLKV